MFPAHFERDGSTIIVSLGAREAQFGDSILSSALPKKYTVPELLSRRDVKVFGAGPDTPEDNEG
jgi:hypothetical protein